MTDFKNNLKWWLSMYYFWCKHSMAEILLFHGKQFFDCGHKTKKYTLWLSLHKYLVVRLHKYFFWYLFNSGKLNSIHTHTHRLLVLLAPLGNWKKKKTRQKQTLRHICEFWAHLQHVGQVLETSPHVLHTFHHVLQVIDIDEKYTQIIKKPFLLWLDVSSH